MLIQALPYALIALGLVNLLFPNSARFWGLGFRRSSGEDHEAVRLMGRIGGALALGIGLVLLLNGGD